jgi:diguanylate cyclase (GGDEF)-like protein
MRVGWVWIEPESGRSAQLFCPLNLAWQVNMFGIGKLVTKNTNSLASRTLRIAALRIGMVSLCVGLISYFVNQTSVEDGVRKQLVLSTEQTLQRESLPFAEIKSLQKNFLAEFKTAVAKPGNRQRLVRDFDLIFYRHADGSYTQRPGVFEGNALPDGHRYAGMSATYAPDIPPNDDIKSRLALSFQLSHKFGSSTKGRLFNFYGVLPEKGFPIYQSVDIAKAFTYSGPDALKLETFEFYNRGFGSPRNDTIFTRMYWDPSNAAWMATVATPDEAFVSGKHRILACVDVLLDELMQRMGKPAIQGAYSAVFLSDADGTLLYHHDLTDEIKKSEGNASIKSLKIEDEYPLLAAVPALTAGKATLIETTNEIVALGIIPETPWVLAVHYPKSSMRPSVVLNLSIVILLGVFTLLVEIFIIRSILQKQVANPLLRLVRAMRLLGSSGEHHLDSADLPTQSKDEVGELARHFASMAERVQNARQQLELKVRERTLELEEANVAMEEVNRKLMEMSTTDGLTGIPNRRRFDATLEEEWRRARRTGSYLMLAMIDVDWFKKYNDHYGHQAGDDCLRNVARILESNAHRAGDLVARYGGEEFALIVTMSEPERALYFAESVCTAIEQAALPHEMSPFGHITVSIGVAGAVPREGETAEALLKKADGALYLAKEQGRNRACLHTPIQKV